MKAGFRLASRAAVSKHVRKHYRVDQVYALIPINPPSPMSLSMRASEVTGLTGH